MFSAIDDVRDPSDALRRQFSTNRTSIRGRQSGNSIIRSESMSRRQVELPGVRRKPSYGRDDKRFVAAHVIQIAERDREVDFFLFLRGTRFNNEVQRSDGHVDGVTVASRRIDAIDANLKFGKREKKTLSQHQSPRLLSRSSVGLVLKRCPV